MLGMGKNTVEIIIAARDRTSAAFAKVNTQMKTMGGTTGKLKSSMGGLSSKMSALATSINPVMIAAGAAAIALATMGGAAIKASLDFEKATATIRVGTGATGEALAGLEDSFKTVFTAVPTTAANAATAIADLNTRLGLTGEPLEALATQFLNLSRITGTDVAAAISSTTRVMHDFAVSSEDQAGALDYLFKVSQSTGIGMTNLANNMTRYGGVMRQMGFDINTSAALLGKFEKEGVNLELVLSSLRMGLANFARAGEEPVEALKRVIAEIQGMGSAADRNLKAIEIFGARSGPDMAAAIYEGRFSIEELMATLDASSETINKAAADALTFGDKWTVVKNNIMTAIEPIGDVILNVLGGAMEGAMAAFALAKTNIGKFKAALAPLTNLIGDLWNKLSGGHSIIQNLKDTVTVLWAGLEVLGDVFIWLVKNAIEIFVKHIKETIEVLTEFYNKLGPLKDIIEFVKGAVDKGVEGFHNYAESFREVEEEADNLMSRLDSMISELEGATDKVTEVPKVIINEWKQAVDAFEAGAGSYKEAISAIDAEIGKLRDSWKVAAEEDKKFYEDGIRLLHDRKVAMEEADKTATEALDKILNLTEEAIETQKEFTVTIGDTTIEFKGMAAEVVKNADAYEKLQKSARTLIDLDWDTFTEFEAALPRIESGLGDLESSFVGFRDVLEDNIDKLENVKLAVMDISEIAAPFLEAGFLEGVKAIGDFAGALSDAGGAINTFAGLQDVSIEGCINFSMHVYDMVSALEILERQMEDLVPAFGDMDLLIDNIADAFLYGAGKAEEFSSSFNEVMGAAFKAVDNSEISFKDFKEIVDDSLDTKTITYWGRALDSNDYETDRWRTQTVDNFWQVQWGIEKAGKAANLFFKIGDWSKTTEFFSQSSDVIKDWARNVYGATLTIEELDRVRELSTKEQTEWLGNFITTNKIIENSFSENTEGLRKWAKETFGVAISTEEAFKVMSISAEEQKIWLDDLMHSEAALTFQMDKQTNALKAQNEQLTKITDALQPYLEFMRTLNELAALSTLSTEELNSGLNAINDTLINLGTSLSTFDLRPVMESLFGTKTLEGEFTGGVAKGFTDTMKDYQGEFKMLIDYISRLSFAIDSLVFSFKALENISESVLADEMKLKDIFSEIEGIMVNFSRVMGEEDFARVFASAFNKMIKSAGPLISYFQENNAEVKLFNSTLTAFATTIKNVVDAMGLLKNISETILPTVTELEAGFGKAEVAISRVTEAISTSFAGVKTEMVELDKEWAIHKEGIDKMLESFSEATNTITTLSSKIVTLSASLKELKDMSVLSMRDIDEALKNIPLFLDGFVDALRLNMYDIKESLKDLHIEWQKHAEDMKETMPSYEASTDAIGKLIGSFVSLHSALESLSEIGTISSAAFDKGFSSLIGSVSNFAVSLTNNVDDLIHSLQKLRVVWVENEAVLFPLIRDFAIITDNLWGIAHNANRMAGEFNNLSKNTGTLEKGFKSLIDFINQVVDSTKEFYTPEAAAELAGFIDDVGAVIQSFVDLEIELKGAMEKIKSAIGTAVDNIKGKIGSLADLVKSAYSSGANMMGGFISGIYSMSAALALAVQRQAAIIDAYLGAKSPTELGPLSHLDEWPRNLMESYSAGIEREMHTLNSSFSGLFAGPASISAGGGGSSTVYLNVTQNISDRDTADYANHSLERLLSRHEVM